jgi:tetratricopeptide (TPR) repeat protein
MTTRRRGYPSPPVALAALVAGALLAVCAGAATAAEPAQAGQVSALREGNRLYREGRLEEAREAYLAGHTPGDVHPVLAYNMATTAHHLGRLPEAILWYRRAATASPADPWMRENLASARASLGLQPYPPPRLSGWIARYSIALSYLATALAWIGLGLWIARPRRSVRPALTLFAAGVLLYGATLLAGRLSPRAAVVLEPCSGEQGDLPAGSEIWITGESGTAYRVVAGEVVLECPRDALEPVVVDVG